MTRILVALAFLISAPLLPWFVTVLIGIVALAYFRLYVVVIIGGLIMDIVFSIPEPHLFGFAYLYTAIFTVCAATTWFLDRAILE